ncbi:hypothetical protein [Curtobacterium sp. RRHDQ10]|uniref:hypothetical protein n=1 Tax=Curtobacterium phyllosphaerae TaxID=3413379 RepID=UPI003BF1EE55
MLVLKRWVWPGLKFLVAVVIAVALVQLAFFPADDSAAGSSAAGGAPTGAIQDPVVPVEKATIRNDVEVKGQVQPVPATTVRATAAGTVNAVRVTANEAVAQGAALLQIKTETPVDPPADPTLPQPKPKVAYTDVTAPVAGTVGSLDALIGQQVVVGETVAVVAPSAFRIAATLQAADLYRLLQRPSEASVVIPGGPAPFTCTNLQIGTTGTGSDAQKGSGDDTDASTSKDSTSLTCDVPADVTVFAGLTATITVPAGVAENVLTVPLTAVSGTASSGTVTLVVADGGTTAPGSTDRDSTDRDPGRSSAASTPVPASTPTHETRDVTLGINDGKLVEVTGGLAEGDTVLQFVPGTDAPEDESPSSGGAVVIR